MNSKTCTTLCGLFVFAMLIGTPARAADWIVVKTFGETWVSSSGVQKVSLSRGRNLPGDATIVTGRDGKVVLARGQQSIILAPNSTIRLNDGRADGEWTTISQDRGLATYLVNKRQGPHFRVRTPSLIAVVKGTKFKVVENRDLSKIWVSEGLVQVSVPRSGMSVDIKAGQSAVLGRGRNSQLEVIGPGTHNPVERTTPRNAGDLPSSAAQNASAAPGRTVAATASAGGQAVSASAGSASGLGAAVSSVASSAGNSAGRGTGKALGRDR